MLSSNVSAPAMMLIPTWLRVTLTISLVCLVILSFWIFSRFTVDDAFISWRYGKNLLDVGIWNYNPAIFDMTQAYTNPVYAILSIVPNALNIDIVFFFKALSIAFVLGFLVWFALKIKYPCFSCWVVILAFFALPATMIHAFGGLETILFVFLFVGLMISMYERSMKSSITFALVLFLTRPESWVLVILLPTYYLIEENNVYRITRKDWLRNYLTGLSFSWKKLTTCFLWLSIPLLTYFALHYMMFGSPLPNTFYAKSSSGINILTLLTFSFFVIPLLLVLAHNRITLFVWFVGLFGAIIFSYSTSSLSMNYAGRFLFHIFAPILLFSVYLSALSGQKALYISYEKNGVSILGIPVRTLINCGLLFLLGFFGVRSTSISEAAHLAGYYPRALDSHAELGKVLSKVASIYDVSSFSLGDAGMAAYHSRLLALDNIGLGSKAVTTQGVSFELLNEYNPDVIVFHATPNGIRLKDYYQEIILDWAIANNYRELCDVYWKPDYTLRIYSRLDIPEIIKLCSSSKEMNDFGNRDYFKRIYSAPPWAYWKE